MTTRDNSVSTLSVDVYNNYLGVSTTKQQITLLQRSLTGTDDPKYKDKINAGVSATHAMVGRKQSIIIKPRETVVLVRSVPLGTKVVSCKESNPLYKTTVPTMPLWDDSLLQLVNNLASTLILKKIRAEQYAISGPTFLGELRESLMMIRRPAQGLQDGAKRYMAQVRKRGRAIARGTDPASLRSAFSSAQFQKILSELWLESSFGWQPLISDIKAAAIAFGKRAYAIRHSHVSSLGRKQALISDGTQQSSTDGQSHIGHRRTILSKEYRVSYKVGLNASLEEPDVGRNNIEKFLLTPFNKDFGFVASEFVPTIWELLPWSFLVDYFSNVGDILNSTMTDQSQVAWVSKSVFRNVVKIQTMILDPLLVAGQYGWQLFVGVQQPDGGFSVSEASEVTRSSGGISTPTLRFELPNVPQLGNMAALFAAQGKMRNNGFL